jgi:predicted esterase
MKFLLILSFTYNFPCFSQAPIDFKLKENIYLHEQRKYNESMSEDTILKMLENWNKFPQDIKSGKNYLFHYDDPYFGKVPVRLYIPQDYKPSIKTPLLLLLHGAVRLSSFSRAENSNDEQSSDDNIFFKYFSDKGYILVRPYADRDKKFDWVVNDFIPFSSTVANDDDVNLTYKTLTDILLKLKHQFNIDDSRVYCLGHSDGSDGTFCMGLFQPTLFAGFVIYNSLLSNLNSNNIYLANAANRPMHIVHSDLDDLRPIQQTKLIAEYLKSIDELTEYKEYYGYKHYDKHLTIDLPLANIFMLRTKRNPIRKIIYWESNNNIDNRCDWLQVDSFDLSYAKSPWQQEKNFKVYNKKARKWEESFYYENTESYAIRGTYEGNSFRIETSRVKKFSILVSANMIDLNKPLKVYANEKLVYNKKIGIDKKILTSSFEREFDRQFICINKIKISINASH